VGEGESSRWTAWDKRFGPTARRSASPTCGRRRDSVEGFFYLPIEENGPRPSDGTQRQIWATRVPARLPVNGAGRTVSRRDGQQFDGHNLTKRSGFQFSERQKNNFSGRLVARVASPCDRRAGQLQGLWDAMVRPGISRRSQRGRRPGQSSLFSARHLANQSAARSLRTGVLCSLQRRGGGAFANTTAWCFDRPRHDFAVRSSRNYGSSTRSNRATWQRSVGPR